MVENVKPNVQNLTHNGRVKPKQTLGSKKVPQRIPLNPDMGLIQVFIDVLLYHLWLSIARLVLHFPPNSKIRTNLLPKTT